MSHRAPTCHLFWDLCCTGSKCFSSVPLCNVLDLENKLPSTFWISSAKMMTNENRKIKMSALQASWDWVEKIICSCLLSLVSEIAIERFNAQVLQPLTTGCLFCHHEMNTCFFFFLASDHMINLQVKLQWINRQWKQLLFALFALPNVILHMLDIVCIDMKKNLWIEIMFL